MNYTVEMGTVAVIYISDLISKIFKGANTHTHTHRMEIA
jgi:hypothetical protein